MIQLLTSLPSKLIVMTICAALFWLGGYSWLAARRFIMPFILALMAFLATMNAWVGICMLTSMGCLCLGYGEKSPLRHVFGNGWGRGVWGLLVAICLSVPLFLTHHLAWPFLHHQPIGPIESYSILLLYLTLNFTLENALKNIPQYIGDPLIGLGFSSILLLIR